MSTNANANCTRPLVHTLAAILCHSATLMNCCWRLQPSSSVVSLTQPGGAGDSNAPAPSLLWFTTSQGWSGPVTNALQIDKGRILMPSIVDQEWLGLRSQISSTSWWFACETVS